LALEAHFPALAGTVSGTVSTAVDRAGVSFPVKRTELTCQFMLEDHAVRHSYHHLSRVRAAEQVPALV
jgi:hypothetical protein